MSGEITNQTIETDQNTVRLSRSFHNIVWISITICFAISILDLIGWIAGIVWLKSLESYWVPMKVITALCFAFTSFALVIIFVKRPVALKTSVPFITGMFIIVVSSLTIFSWFYLNGAGQESSITSLPVLSLFLSPITRMALLTAFIFFSFGIILILLNFDNPTASDIAHILCFPAAISGYMIPVSYLLNIYSIHEFLGTPVALNTGIAVCAVSVAVYLIRPDTWLMRVFTTNNIGGIMARRLFPWLILFPVIIAWLRIQGEHTGFFVSEVGVLLVTVTYSFCFVLLIWFTARSVNLIDSRRHIADEALKKSHEELEKRVRERTSELLNLNKVLDEEIKERIKAEQLVEAERLRMNGLLELMPAYIILLTPDYHVSYANRYFRERFGESHGKHCFEFLFNRTEPCEICETYRTLKENKPITWEWTGPDGHIYSIYDFPHEDSDGSPLIMEMGIDVTNLKKAEANLVTLNAELEQRVEERTTELVMINERLDILSQTSSRLLASENPRELINSLCIRVMKFMDCHVFFNFLTEDSKDKLHLNAYYGIPEKTAQKIEWLDFGVEVCGCVARDGVRIVTENIFEAPDPRTNHIKSLGIKAYACYPLMSHDKVIGTLSFGTRSRIKFSEDDLSLMNTVTDQVSIAMTRVRDEELLRQSEEALKKSESRLKELNATKDKFFNIIAHDLKNPFTCLIGSTELLSENIRKMGNNEIKELVQILNDSAKGGYEILRNLLDWSRSQTGLLTFSPERIDLKKIIDTNISELRLSSDKKKIRIISEVKKPMYIFADKNMMNSVLRNLLGNAIKFTQKSGTVTINAIAKKNMVSVQVTDTGIGIPEDKLNELFRIDTKYTRPGTDKESGTGLGLKICKEFVEIQGGEIRVESILNTGTKFIFSIPLKET
jgi:signal transduction histidine kinase/PAS domain-containing protein